MLVWSYTHLLGNNILKRCYVVLHFGFPKQTLFLTILQTELPLWIKILSLKMLVVFSNDLWYPVY